MPLQLDITAAGIAPQFAPASSGVLIAHMVWPGFGQGDQRAKYLKSYSVYRRVDEAKAVPATFRVEMLDQIIRDVVPPSEFKDLPRRVREGITVGEYYATAIEQDRLGLPVSVKQLKSYLTRRERRRLHPAADIRESQLRDLLREYRPAAHLWTAEFLWSVFERDLAGPWIPDRIGEFLALSEAIADRLAAIRLERRNKPLLGPGADLWRVPPSLVADLPQVDWNKVNWPGGQSPLPHDLFKLHEYLRLAP